MELRFFLTKPKHQFPVNLHSLVGTFIPHSASCIPEKPEFGNSQRYSQKGFNKDF